MPSSELYEDPIPKQLSLSVRELWPYIWNAEAIYRDIHFHGRGVSAGQAVDCLLGIIAHHFYRERMVAPPPEGQAT